MSQFAHVARENSVNHKVIEICPCSMYVRVSRFDEDRQKYTFNETFETFEDAEKKYFELIDEEYEKMSHQF